MRVVTNEALISRNKKISQALYFGSFILLIASFFFLNQLAASDAVYAFQCVLIPVMFGLVLVAVRMTNTWVRQPHPWEAIPQGLKGISADNTLYNYLFPFAEHVLVGPNGIFVLETRFHDRPQKVVGDEWQDSKGLFTFMRQEQLGNPSRDAQQKASAVSAFLQELTGDSSLEALPIVVFTHPNAEITMEGEQSVPVVYAFGSRKEKNSLKNLLQQMKGAEHPTLTPQQQALLDDTLLYEDKLAEVPADAPLAADGNGEVVSLGESAEQDSFEDEETPEPVGAVEGGAATGSGRKKRGKKRRR